MTQTVNVKRIVADIEAAAPAQAEPFYERVLGLKPVMDQGWIRTYSNGEMMPVQISFASEGGAGTPVPDLSIEVDNLDVVLDRLQREGIPLEYGPVSEPWGVRRCFVRDPFGKLLNLMQHANSAE